MLLFESLKCDKLCNVTRVTRGCRLSKPDNWHLDARQCHVTRVRSLRLHCAPALFESVFADKQNNGLWERRRGLEVTGDYSSNEGL